MTDDVAKLQKRVTELERHNRVLLSQRREARRLLERIDMMAEQGDVLRVRFAVRSAIEALAL